MTENSEDGELNLGFYRESSKTISMLKWVQFDNGEEEESFFEW